MPRGTYRSVILEHSLGPLVELCEHLQNCQEAGIQGGRERTPHTLPNNAAVTVQSARVSQPSMVVARRGGDALHLETEGSPKLSGTGKYPARPHIPGLASRLCVSTKVFLALEEFPYLSSRAQLTENSRSDESEENPERTQGSHAAAAAQPQLRGKEEDAAGCRLWGADP